MFDFTEFKIKPDCMFKLSAIASLYPTKQNNKKGLKSCRNYNPYHVFALFLFQNSYTVYLCGKDSHTKEWSPCRLTAQCVEPGDQLISARIQNDTIIGLR